jgi:hypothetical protein
MRVVKSRRGTAQRRTVARTSRNGNTHSAMRMATIAAVAAAPRRTSLHTTRFESIIIAE